MEEGKNCNRCHEYKLFSEFNKQSSKKDGRRSLCRKCTSISSKKYYDNNRDLITEKQRDYYSSNYDIVKATKKKYSDANREKINAKSAEYAKNNKDIINSRKRELAARDPQYKLKKNLRTRIWKSLKGINKSANTMELLGCSIEDFKAHLESKFDKTMSFDNYGEWHVDHVIPCASFDLTDENQQRECFNYRNLQPMWAVDNIKKGAKIEEGVQRFLVL